MAGAPGELLLGDAAGAPGELLLGDAAGAPGDEVAGAPGDEVAGAPGELLLDEVAGAPGELPVVPLTCGGGAGLLQAANNASARLIASARQRYRILHSLLGA